MSKREEMLIYPLQMDVSFLHYQRKGTWSNSLFFMRAEIISLKQGDYIEDLVNNLSTIAYISAFTSVTKT